MLYNPFASPGKPPETPRQTLLRRLSEGVPPELVARAAAVAIESFEGDAEIQQALAEGEIALFERARDNGGATGIVRAAMRYEARTWVQNVEPKDGKSLEDYLRD